MDLFQILKLLLDISQQFVFESETGFLTTKLHHQFGSQ